MQQEDLGGRSYDSDDANLSGVSLDAAAAMLSDLPTTTDLIPPTPVLRHSMQENLRQPLPMFLVILLGFLLCDAVVRLAQGVELFSQSGGISQLDKQQLFEHLVVSTFYLLLLLQVLLRTLAARIWGTIVFLFHSVWLVIRYGYHNPGLIFPGCEM